MIGSLVLTSTVILCAAEEPKAKPAPPDAVYIVGQDLKQLLEAPDAVILTGEEARKYLEAVKQRDPAAARALSVLECRIRGELRGGMAQLSFQVVVRSDTELATPLHLGPVETGQVFSAKTDGQLARLSWDDDGLIAWIEGKGQHTLAIELLLPLAGSQNLPALVCSIPEAPVTTLELKVPRPVSDVKFNPAAPGEVGPPDNAKAQLVTATLGPRKKLDLQWRWADQPGAQTEPLVRAGSDVTLTVEPGVIRIETVLVLQVLRGAQQTWELRPGAGERVLDIDATDGSDIQWRSRDEEGHQRITVQFPAPVTGRTELSISSEIPWSGNAPSVRGLTVVGALSHRSKVTLRSSAELDVAVTGMEHARAAEAAPASARSLRGEAAFVAFAQPFQLKLSVLPRRPTATARTVAVLSFVGDEKVTVFERWQFSVHGGRLSQVSFALPRHFEPTDFQSLGAESVRLEQVGETRVARVFLPGTADEFELRLRATVPLMVAQSIAKLDLPRPLEVRSESSRLYLKGHKHLALEPTSELEVTDELLESALAQELGLEPLALRGFETAAMLDRVAFRVSRQVPRVKHLSIARIKVDPDYLEVTQSFDYSVREGHVHRLRLSVPASVRGSLELLSRTGHVESITEEGELSVELDGESADSFDLEFRFRVPVDPNRTAAGVQTVSVPLLRALDGSCESTEVAVSGPWTLDLAIADGAWRPVSAGATATNAANSGARLLVRQWRDVDAVTIGIAARSSAPGPLTIVDRALVETTVGADGEWHTRARYLIASAATDKLRIEQPADSRITALRLAGVPLLDQAIVEPSTGTLVVELGATELPAVLEIQTRSPRTSTRNPRLWFRSTWSAPVLTGDVAWGRVLWQLTLPDRLVVLRGPDQYSDENRWRWFGTAFRRDARQDEATLEHWLTGRAPGPVHPTVADGRRYLYSRLVSIEPISIGGVSRWLLVLVASGAVLVLGIVARALPLRWQRLLVLVALAAILVASALEPVAAVECVQSAGLGLVIVLVAWLALRWLARRPFRTRTVFPEPGMLARAQGSSVRPASGSPRLGSPPSAPQAPPAPTASEPHFAPQPSSVR